LGLSGRGPRPVAEAKHSSLNNNSFGGRAKVALVYLRKPGFVEREKEATDASPKAVFRWLEEVSDGSIRRLLLSLSSVVFAGTVAVFAYPFG